MIALDHGDGLFMELKIFFYSSSQTELTIILNRELITSLQEAHLLTDFGSLSLLLISGQSNLNETAL
jgi:hypothetical protein